MLRFGLVLAAWLLLVLPSFACSVPVFRYALERWQPSRYELVIFHDGPLASNDRDAVQSFQKAAHRANIRLVDVDVTKALAPDFRGLWEREGKNTALPRMVLRYPESGPMVPSVWTGPLSASPELLLASSARQAIFDRLTAGFAGVVILLLSGDKTADDAARLLLETQLPKIASQIKLPVPTDDGPQVQSAIPLRINFPIVEVARTAEESTLVRILLGSEAGLADVQGPIVFPVFGRGRALCSLHGKDLRDPAELQRSLEFLCAACSCQVKELNPGVDLLITANWDAIFDAELGPAPRVVTQAAEIRTATKPGVMPAESRSPPPSGYAAAEFESGANATSSRSLLLKFGTALAAALVLLTGFWAMRSHRKSPPNP